MLIKTLLLAICLTPILGESGAEDLCQKPGKVIFEDLKKFYCKLDLDNKRNLLLCDTVDGVLAEDLLSTLR